MEACLKCGHEIINPKELSCPKCGVVFEKIKKLVEAKKKGERLSRQSDTAMHSEFKARSSAYDLEYGVENLAEKRNFGILDNLSFGIYVLALIAVCVDALGLVYLNNSLFWMQDQERIFILVAVGISALCATAAFIAIAVFLNMSKEIAKNTWSTKEYLKRISESLNEGQ